MVVTGECSKSVLEIELSPPQSTALNINMIRAAASLPSVGLFSSSVIAVEIWR